MVNIAAHGVVLAHAAACHAGITGIAQPGEECVVGPRPEGQASCFGVEQAHAAHLSVPGQLLHLVHHSGSGRHRPLGHQPPVVGDPIRQAQVSLDGAEHFAWA